MSIHRTQQAVLVVGCALAASGLALGHELTWDDRALLERSSVVTGDVVRILTTSYWEEVTGRQGGLYRPVLLMWASMLHALGGGSVAVMHAGSVLAHTFAALSLRAAAIGLGASPVAATAAAALFAVHPLATEVSNTVVGSGDSLALALSLCAVYLIGHRGRFAPVALGAALFLAPLAKVSSVIGGAALVLWRGGTVSPWRDRRLWIASGALLMALAVRWTVTGHVGVGTIGFVDNPLAGAPLSVRWMNAVLLPLHYLTACLFPWPLSADYSYDQLPLATSPAAPVWFGVALLLSMGAALRSLRVLQGEGIFWLTLVTGHGLLLSQIVVPIGTLFAERLAYPLIAVLCVVVTRGHPRWARHPCCRWVLPAALLVGLTLSVHRAADWRDDLALFERTVETSARSAKAHRGLGQALQERGRYEEAVAAYDQALAIYPRFRDAEYNRAAALLMLARWGEASAGYERVLALAPRHVGALFGRAVCVHQLHGPAAARPLYEEVLRLDPAHAGARRALAGAAQ